MRARHGRFLARIRQCNDKAKVDWVLEMVVFVLIEITLSGKVRLVRRCRGHTRSITCREKKMDNFTNVFIAKSPSLPKPQGLQLNARAESAARGEHRSHSTRTAHQFAGCHPRASGPSRRQHRRQLCGSRTHWCGLDHSPEQRAPGRSQEGGSTSNNLPGRLLRRLRVHRASWSVRLTRSWLSSLSEIRCSGAMPTAC